LPLEGLKRSLECELSHCLRLENIANIKDANEVIEAFQRNGIPAKVEGENIIFEHVWVEAYISL